MSSNLYLLFETQEGANVALPEFLQEVTIPGYTFWRGPLKHTIKVPGESAVPTRCLFYAQNYFRISISDLVMQFYREITLPAELAAGEKSLQAAAFNLSPFRLRRWIITDEDWDENDDP